MSKVMLQKEQERSIDGAVRKSVKHILNKAQADINEIYVFNKNVNYNFTMSL